MHNTLNKTFRLKIYFEFSFLKNLQCYVGNSNIDEEQNVLIVSRSLLIRETKPFLRGYSWGTK